MLKLFRTILIVFIFYFSGQGANLSYTGQEIFPLHEEMLDATNFWVKVFAVYNTNQYLVHDSREMGVIYEVLKWGETEGSSPDVPFSKEQKDFFNRKTDYYKEILSGIAAVFPDTGKMTGPQKNIFRNLTSFTSKKDFLDARERIRIQRGLKNRFKRGMEISGRFMPYLEEIFNKYGLPAELTVLPHVESSFNYEAYSSAGAAGIWQFTRGTGKQFLHISYEVDERLDPILATEAAAKLLKQNYNALGSWPLAITAYNHGLNGMKRAVKTLNTTDMNTIIKNYRSRYFKFASRNFYCEFIAALHVVQNYQSYFGPVDFEEPMKFREFPLARFTKFETLAGHLDMDDELFHKYNPALRKPIYNNSKYIPKGYRLKLPAHMELDSLLAAIPQEAFVVAQKQSDYYQIRPGDTLSEIARRFGTTIEMLLITNDISNMHFLREGMTIRIPDKGESIAVRHIPAIAEAAPVTAEVVVTDQNTVIDPIIYFPFWQMEFPLQDSSAQSLTAGTPSAPKRTIPDIEFVRESDPAIGYIRVEPEETLGHYSDWLKIKTQKIRDWNNISFNSSLQLRQKVKLVFEKVKADEFNRMRLEYHHGLEEDFFTNYEITDTLTHRIKSGDNIWYLCNYVYNLPYWLIVDYNRDVDFEKLKPGDLLVIPSIKARG